MFPLISVGLISEADLYEPDVQAVINAIQATGVGLSPAQQKACSDRIAAFKTDGIWSKLIAYYGFLGGTAASHAINWRSPGTYNLSWGGTVSHSVQGVQNANGSGHGDTGYNPATAGLLTTKVHLSLYSRTNSAEEAADIGIRSGGLANFGIYSRWSNGICYFDAPESSRFSTAIDSSSGLITGSISDGAVFVSRNGATVASGTVAVNSVAGLNRSLWILQANSDQGGGDNLPSLRQYASFSFGYELTQAQAIANYASEQAYQTAIGRQV